MTRLTRLFACSWTVISAMSALAAEPNEDIRELKLRDWQPRSMLVAKNAERLLYASAPQPAAAEPKEPRAAKVVHVKPTDDFAVTGDGTAAPWKDVAWVPLAKRGGGLPYDARFKLLYSKQGLYVLMNGTDARLTGTMQEDFLDLWKQDVFEFFLWTDERHPIYFEYEISPLGYELPILIPNIDGKFLGWRPWHYEGDRKVRKATTVVGDKTAGAAIGGWTAEVFVPYKLLEPLAGVPPKPNTRWRANFYRVDYDEARTTEWDWARVGPSFHEYQKFGTLVFD